MTIPLKFLLEGGKKNTNWLRLGCFCASLLDLEEEIGGEKEPAPWPTVIGLMSQRKWERKRSVRTCHHTWWHSSLGASLNEHSSWKIFFWHNRSLKNHHRQEESNKFLTIKMAGLKIVSKFVRKQSEQASCLFYCISQLCKAFKGSFFKKCYSVVRQIPINISNCSIQLGFRHDVANLVKLWAEFGELLQV